MTTNNEVMVKPQTNYLSDVKSTKELCALLMEEPHYAKHTAVGVFAIIETAKSLNIDPRLALGGGLYYVKGKVEMCARMMASLIRQRKHSVTKDSKSNEQICILHGKRADTGDCWTASFSIDEAKAANLLNNNVWKVYPTDMLYARALSRLARQLFPDVIGNCYVKGEIDDDPNIKEEKKEELVEVVEEITIEPEYITDEQIKELENYLVETNTDPQKLLVWRHVASLKEIKTEDYKLCIEAMIKIKNNQKKVG